MRRCYLHLRDHVDEILDPEGAEYKSMEDLKADVLAAARDVMTGDLTRGIIDLRYRIDAEDGQGNIVHTLSFEHAVTIITKSPAPTS